MAGFFCRSDPAALLRGLANGALPSATRRALSSAKSSRRKKTSPRTSSSEGTGRSGVGVRVTGMSSIVRALRVTSSPVLPSPRVAALTSFPSR